MGEPGGHGRPPVFSGSLWLDLDKYRRFRHRLGHLYGYELEAARVLTLGRGVKSLLACVKTSVAAFNRWLEGQAESYEGDGT
jgi:hypothetical protein